MTVWTQEADMPELDLPGGSYFQLEAIDPSTGAAVTGVTVTDVAIYGLDISQALGALEDVVPAWTPLEVEENL